jgi:hypothetical protein
MSDMIGAGERATLDAGSGTERPLSDEERAQVSRLLSDPFSYPIQFKTWLVSFLEGSDLLLPRSSVQGLTDLLGSGGGQGILGLLPAGMVFPYGGASAPTGAFLCNGAAYSRVGYKRLFDAIGTVFGAGDGSTTFNVPDLRRRLPYGTGGSLGGFAIGATGNESEGRDIRHYHSYGGTGSGSSIQSGSGFGANNSTFNTSPGSASGFPKDAPSYLVLNFITNY